MAGQTLKICGVTNAEDAALIGESGADYCGILIDVGFSERSLSFKQAKIVAASTSATVVILLGDPTVDLASKVDAEIKPYAIQLTGRESPEFVRELKSVVKSKIWKTVHLPVMPGQASVEEYVDAGADALLVDSVDTSEGFARMGGTGKLADWNAAREIIAMVDIPVYLAGGIAPDNVIKAVLEVRSAGVDLCSGVEAVKGKKDPGKIKELVANFKEALIEAEKE